MPPRCALKICYLFYYSILFFLNKAYFAFLREKMREYFQGRANSARPFARTPPTPCTRALPFAMPALGWTQGARFFLPFRALRLLLLLSSRPSEASGGILFRTQRQGRIRSLAFPLGGRCRRSRWMRGVRILFSHAPPSPAPRALFAGRGKLFFEFVDLDPPQGV